MWTAAAVAVLEWGVWVAAAAAASVDPLPVLVGAFPVGALVGVWVPNSAVTDAFEDAAITAPVQGPPTHVVVGAVVDDAAFGAFRSLRMCLGELQPVDWLSGGVPVAWNFFRHFVPIW